MWIYENGDLLKLRILEIYMNGDLLKLRIIEIYMNGELSKLRIPWIYKNGDLLEIRTLCYKNGDYSLTNILMCGGAVGL